MGAFNTIKIIHSCPFCKKNTEIVCQTHMASSFDGDYEGRFCHTTYNLGEPMRWWDKKNPLYTNWKEGNFIRRQDLPDNADIESCYSNCSICMQEMYVVILFIDVVPITVIDIGTITRWPVLFSK